MGKGRTPNNCVLVFVGFLFTKKDDVREGHYQMDGGFGYKMACGWNVGDANFGKCFHLSTDVPF